MAGAGRNYSVLKKKFKYIEMLDASKEMAEEIPYDVEKHLCYIELFKWPSKKYHCIVGVFCLCYIEKSWEITSILSKMEESCVDFGYLLFMEPVLSTDDDVNERDHPDTGQKMKIRSVKYY